VNRRVEPVAVRRDLQRVHGLAPVEDDVVDHHEAREMGAKASREGAVQAVLLPELVARRRLARLRQDGQRLADEVGRRRVEAARGAGSADRQEGGEEVVAAVEVRHGLLLPAAA
jgi:hypothetical protein